MVDQEAMEYARYIFGVGKKLRRHVFTRMARLKMDCNDCAIPDLSVAQLDLLMSVRSQGEVSLGGLAALLGVSPPSASVMVEKLVERGLLIRERSTVDRRKVMIRVSPGESERLDRMEQRLLASFVELVEEVGMETAARWAEVLRQVEQVLQRCEEGDGNRGRTRQRPQ
ncbi:MAG TPA: MarR family transcriptional regulator [Desulfobulbus sp.]|nr:MarR family transcriptional regulator [Desulfobulbus sp.]